MLGKMKTEVLANQRRALACNPELWQFRLLTPEALSRRAHELGISFLNEAAIVSLWRSGLVRADCARSESSLAIPDLVGVQGLEGVYTYCDERPAPDASGGWGGLFTPDEQALPDVEVLFHPFRLYVLRHVARVFELSISTTQYLHYPDGLANLARSHVEWLDTWTSSEAAAERFDHWNATAELAIALEPAVEDPDVLGAAPLRARDWNGDKSSSCADNAIRTQHLVAVLSLDEIAERRKELGQQAQVLDENRHVHVLMRFMSAHERRKLKGSLGACMHLLCMAEVIRRVVEQKKGVPLPEEDEIGFGQWIPGARKAFYGTERIFDAPDKTRRDFLTSMGLDAGIKARCYVEGDTEIGSLKSAVGEAGGIEFINLKGQFAQAKGKGASFADSLSSDKEHHIFSIVVLDFDRDDNVRIVKNAESRGQFFGLLFTNSPDIEFGNFTAAELVDIVLKRASDEGLERPPRGDMMAKVASARSGREFFAALEDTTLARLGKDKRWGEYLMSYAVDHPILPAVHPNKGKKRQLGEIAWRLSIARQAGYLRSVAASKTQAVGPPPSDDAP
jgi:hypothetical protein